MKENVWTCDNCGIWVKNKITAGDTLLSSGVSAQPWKLFLCFLFLEISSLVLKKEVLNVYSIKHIALYSVCHSSPRGHFCLCENENLVLVQLFYCTDNVFLLVVWMLACRPFKTQVHLILGLVCFLGKQIPRVWQDMPSLISCELCFLKPLTHFLIWRCKPWEQHPPVWVGVTKFMTVHSYKGRCIQKSHWPSGSMCEAVHPHIKLLIAHCCLTVSLPIKKVRWKAGEITSGEAWHHCRHPQRHKLQVWSPQTLNSGWTVLQEWRVGQIQWCSNSLLPFPSGHQPLSNYSHCCPLGFSL